MNVFENILVEKPTHSTHDLSFDHKLSFKMGKIIPINITECLPGDKFEVFSQAMLRMAPMIAPIMHKVSVDIHHFFCPLRILWPGFEQWITGGEKGSPIPAFPTMDNTAGSNTYAESSLGDYLGVPTGIDMFTSDQAISAMPFAAYQRIYHEWFRDENLNTQDMITLTDGMQTGLQTDKLKVLQTRAWEHDYFTSQLPWPQKGQPVTIPIDLVGRAPIILDNQTDPQLILDPAGNPYDTPQLGSNISGELEDGNAPGATPLWLDPNDTLSADLTAVGTATNINELRSAIALQRWLEASAVGGSRMTETLKVMFNVRAQDSRLQRPEYIGKSRATMSISEVLQNAPPVDADSTPQGNMAGHGISVTQGHNAEYFCYEWGFFISTISILPKTCYQQGLPKFFSKTLDRTQYFWRQFAHLGEQAVPNKEVFLKNGDPTYNEDTFGYLPIYSEYRSNPSRVSGAMKTSLNFWHMGRIFDPASPPLLNLDFIECNPTKRIFAVEDEDQDEIVAHIFHNIRMRRPIPYYGQPGTI